MSVVIPDAGGTYWASLTFAYDYFKLRQAAASSPDKGVTAEDMNWSCAKAQHILESMLRRHYSKATVDAWSGDNVPPLIQDWASELAAAYTYHAVAAPQTDRRKEHSSWVDEVLKRVHDFLASGGVLLDVSGEAISGTSRGVGARYTDHSTGRVFSEDVVKDLVERHGPLGEEYLTQAESLRRAT